MEKKLSKKQRHGAYKKALTLLPESGHFACAAVKNATDYKFSCEPKNFPELFLFHDDHYGYSDAWLSREENLKTRYPKGKRLRKAVIQLCIEMTR